MKTLALGVLGCLVVVGCASSEAKPPTDPPVGPTVTMSVVLERIPVGRSLTVGGDIYHACHLDAAGEPSATPKFAFDESLMTREDVLILDKVAECLTHGALAGRRVELIGRADPRGTEEYNLTLGARRAHSVALYLEQHKVPGASVNETSRGALDAKGNDEATFAQDRRVDVALIKQ